MDIFLQLDRELVNASAAGLPVAWARDLRLAGHASASALAATVRGIGNGSDVVVEALMAVTERQELADTIILAATVGLVRNRCGRGVVSTEDLLAEVAISIGECRRDGVPTTERHLVNVLLDRAWDRARMPYQRAQGVAVVGSNHIERLVVDDGDVERMALNRVAMLEFRQRLQAGVETSPAAASDLTMKSNALARTTPPNTPPGRYKPGDTLLAFLEAH